MKSEYPIIVNLNFAILEIYEELIISSVNEGIVFDSPELAQFHAVFDTYFQGKKFGFISNRKNDYTVTPTAFIKISKNNGLIGVAILCHSKSSYDNSLFVKKFYSKPYKSFYTLQECKEWLKTLK